MGVSKFVYGGTTKFDITDSTVTAAGLAYGLKAYGADGEPITGSNTYDADTSDANAIAGDILATKTAYVNGTKITGSMTNRGAVTGTISDLTNGYTVPSGYHDGSGTVDIDSTEKAKIIAGNIKDGVEILGVTGTYTGAGVTAQAKTATPTTSQQVILPDNGYDYLSQVTVEAIPYTETENAQGGTTITIAGA